MKRTKKSGIAASCLAAALLIGGAFAYLTDTDEAVNRFSFLDSDGEETIDIDLTEPNWDETDENENDIPDVAENAIYGRPITKDPVVTNIGENDVYTFVTVLVPTAEVVTSNDDGTHNAKTLRELYTLKLADSNDPQGFSGVAGADRSAQTYKYNTTNWVEISDTVGEHKVVNDEGTFAAHTFLYKGILSQDDATEALFDAVEVINLVDGERTDDDDVFFGQIPADQDINIYVNSYAIQAEAVKDLTIPVTGGTADVDTAIAGDDAQKAADKIWSVYVNDADAKNGGAGKFDVFAPAKDAEAPNTAAIPAAEEETSAPTP